MNNSDREEFDAVIIAMAELFDRKMSAIQLDLYFEALKDMSLEDFRKSANTVARTCKFFPKPVEFREQIIVGVDAQATLALDKVQEAFWSAGVYKSVVFDDPVIHAVIDHLGGWVKYCNTPDHELKWWKKDFEKKYSHYASVINSLNPPKVLFGLYAEDGHATEGVRRPMLMGDSQKVLEWTGQKALPTALAEWDKEVSR